MNNRIACAVTGAALLTLCASTGASAQLTPTVATITVPVKISNLDAEWANRSFGSMLVACEVFKEASPPESPGAKGSIASGTQPIPLVETPATSTVRAMLNYNGSVAVQTHVLASAAGSDDPETKAQSLAATAIKEARSYGCYFIGSKTSAVPGSGALAGGVDMAKVLPKGYESGDAAEKGSIYYVTGTFPPPKK